MATKDKGSITHKSGVIYRYRCDRLEFDEENIGESARAFGEGFRNISGLLLPFMTLSK